MFGGDGVIEYIGVVGIGGEVGAGEIEERRDENRRIEGGEERSGGLWGEWGRFGWVGNSGGEGGGLFLFLPFFSLPMLSCRNALGFFLGGGIPRHPPALLYFA